MVYNWWNCTIRGISVLHATLPPSSANRWLLCPASAKIADSKIIDSPKIPTYVGVALHEIFNSLLDRFGNPEKNVRPRISNSFRDWANTNLIDLTDQEHLNHGDYLYTRRLTELLITYHWVTKFIETEIPGPMNLFLTEQRLEIGSVFGVKNSDLFGTADLIVHRGTTLTVLDYKSGVTPVNPENNPQLELYAFGALNIGLPLVTQVNLAIYQPSTSTPLKIFSCTLDELLARKPYYKTGVIAALNPEPLLKPSREACRWCPHRASCIAHRQQSILEDFTVVPQ